MVISDVLENFKKDLEHAKEELAEAKEIVEIGVEAKFNVAKQRETIREIESKIKLYETVINRHIKNHASK